MTNDIEAAARAVIEAWDRPPLGAYAQTMHEAVSHLRSALAHAARGEPVRSWRDVEGTLPARRDGDKVARVDPETAIPATGEAGTRGEDAIRADERERCAKVCRDKAERYRVLAKNYADRSDRDGTPTGDIAGYLMNLRERSGAAEVCADAIDALPEAREGGGK